MQFGVQLLSATSLACRPVRSYLLAKTTVLDSAVQKRAHKTIVGSRSRLRSLAIPAS
jgi:hypothetical protein